MEAVGRGLALCLTHPGLPASLRWPVVGGVGRAMGMLFAQLLSDRLFLRRDRETRRFARRMTPRERWRRSSPWTLVCTRGRLLSRAEVPELAARRQHAAERLSSIVGVPIPSYVSLPWWRYRQLPLVRASPHASRGWPRRGRFGKRSTRIGFETRGQSEPIRAAAGRGTGVPGQDADRSGGR